MGADNDTQELLGPTVPRTRTGTNIHEVKAKHHNNQQQPASLAAKQPTTQRNTCCHNTTQQQTHTSGLASPSHAHNCYCVPHAIAHRGIMALYRLPRIHAVPGRQTTPPHPRRTILATAHKYNLTEPSQPGQPCVHNTTANKRTRPSPPMARQFRPMYGTRSTVNVQAPSAWQPLDAAVLP